MTEPHREIFDVLIIGAGPVGLFLANMLGRAHIRTLVLERRTAIPPDSRAIGITPPTLHLAQKLGIVDTFINRGTRITDVQIFGSQRKIADLNLGVLPAPYNFILSLPETIVLHILESNLRQLPFVTLEKGCEVGTISDLNKQVVAVQYRNEAKVEHLAHSRLIVGCDGEKSIVRSSASICFPVRNQPGQFVMGDTTDRLGMGSTVRLYFTATGAIESFPLPQGRRRWVAQIDNRNLTSKSETLSALIQKRTGVIVSPNTFEHVSTFGLKSAIASQYYSGNVILCGDASHIMSPIGGQGMNVGLADAYSLGKILIQKHKRRRRDQLLMEWQTMRKKAASVAIRRASVSGWIGTRSGSIQSVLRNFGIGLATNRLTKRHIATHFSMWTIPHSDFRE